ncbi:MAG TPA: diacylglycerol kinase family protein [Cyclobacteriaceae bacterium]|nr:diacylglycerol kinase family protein [Cyclobacteriaceae bacterium]
MKKFLTSFLFALNGLKTAVVEQLNLKIQIAVAVLVVAAGLHFDITNTEWAILIFTIGLVLGFELLNTALENLVDLVTMEKKPLAGKVKDIAAGAVLLVSVLSVVVGWLIFKSYLFAD